VSGSLTRRRQRFGRRVQHKTMTYRHGSADLDSGDDGHMSHFGSPISSAPGSARWAIHIFTYAMKTTPSSPSALSPGHYCPSLCPLIHLFPTPAARYRQGSYKDPGSARSYGTPRDGRRSMQATPRTPGESLRLCGKAHIFPLSGISLISACLQHGSCIAHKPLSPGRSPRTPRSQKSSQARRTNSAMPAWDDDQPVETPVQEDMDDAQVRTCYIKFQIRTSWATRWPLWPWKSISA
jgi:hypothetical protein